MPNQEDRRVRKILWSMVSKAADRSRRQRQEIFREPIIIIIIIIIIIKNECHSNIIVDGLQGCSHSKKLRESESESRSSKVV